MANRASGNQGIIMSGNASINAHNLAVGDHALINSHDVISQLGRLKEEIDSLPDGMARQKAELEKHRSALEAEAQKPKPDRSRWEVSAHGLMEAAKAVASVTPSILATAIKLAGWVTSVL
jgi:hypothetical protein